MDRQQHEQLVNVINKSSGFSASNRKKVEVFAGFAVKFIHKKKVFLTQVRVTPNHVSKFPNRSSARSRRDISSRSP